MTLITQRFLSKREAAEFLGVTQSCMNQWHARGVGPVRTKIGPRRVFFALSDLEAFLAEGRKRDQAEVERQAAARQRRKTG